jgi:hypothetical protein
MGMGNATNGNAISSSAAGPFPPGIYRELNLVTIKSISVLWYKYSTLKYD